MYWLGTITARNSDGTYRIDIESGDTEPNVPADPKYVIPYRRGTVFEGKEVLVCDGHTLVPGEGEKGEIVGIRLLSFRSSPHLYQSGTLLSAGSLRWAPIAFEIIQAMCTSLAFLQHGNPHGQCSAAFIGGGSGNLPMTARKLFTPLLRQIDVVEISPEVMHVAQQHFGLQEDDVVTCHVADGSKFIADAAEGSYDMIAIDAADHDASDDGPNMEAPPLCLYTEEFMRGPLHSALRRGGFVIVNAIGRRRQLAMYCERFKTCGYWPVYAFAINPNVVFFAWKSEVSTAEREEQEVADFFINKDKKKSKRGAFSDSKKSDLESGRFTHSQFRELIQQTPPLLDLIPSILGPVLEQTQHCHEKKEILGWFGIDAFHTKLLDGAFKM